MEKAIAVVGCMDWRLVDLLTILDNGQMTFEGKVEKAKGLFKDPEGRGFLNFVDLIRQTHGRNVIVLANAGSNINGLSKTLSEIKGKYELEGVMVVGHFSSQKDQGGFDLGCGGKKAVVSLLTDMASGAVVPEDAYAHFTLGAYETWLGSGGIDQSGFKSLDSPQKLKLIDDASKEIQAARAKAFSSNVGFFAVDTEDLKLHSDGAHVYRITGKAEDTEIDKNFATSKMHLEVGKTLIIADGQIAGYSKAPAKKTKVA